MLLWLTSEKIAVWERRIGCFNARCQGCNQEGWQLTLHMWRSRGTQMSPPTPWSPIWGQTFQVRCSLCGVAAVVGPPELWVPQQAPGFVYEQHHPATPANPAYMALAVASMR